MILLHQIVGLSFANSFECRRWLLVHDVSTLVRQAMAAASVARWDEAERLWSTVRAHDPAHPLALHSLGVHAFRRGDSREALALLQQAHAAAPHDATILLTVAMVLEQGGDHVGQLRALDAALARQPTLLPALLAKVECLDAMGRSSAEVAPWVRASLQAAGPEKDWPKVLRSRIESVVQRCRELDRALSVFIDERLGDVLAALGSHEKARWHEARAILCEGAKPYLQAPARLLVPRLAALPFHDPARFPWVDALQRQTAAIREEFLALWADSESTFKPYIAFGEGAPLGVWADLNHSPRWASRFLWRNGIPDAAVQARCPVTVEVLDRVGMADIDGLCPNAMFSVLAPQTHIPPHTGETNARLVVHLPLVVPEGCRYRVGADWREWREGEVLIFDDSIEHEARNDSSSKRVVLIFDVWHPDLSLAERDVVRELSSAMRDFEPAS